MRHLEQSDATVFQDIDITMNGEAGNLTLSGVMLPLGEPSPTKANPGESGGVIGMLLVMGDASGV